MATLASMTKPGSKPLTLAQPGAIVPTMSQSFGGSSGPADASIFNALATGNQSGVAGAGSGLTNTAVNNAFYHEGVANPWYQANQLKLNRTGPLYQPGGMFYNPAIDGPGGSSGVTPAGAGGQQPAAGTPAPHGDNFPGAAPVPAAPGAVPSAAGGASGQPDWSKIDVSKFMDPNVDYRIGKGSDAIQNSAAARGGLLSGNTLKGIIDYANNEAGAAYKDAQSAAFNDRDFMRGTYKDDRDYTTALGQFNAQLAQRQNEFGSTLGENRRQFDNTLGQRQYEYGTTFDEGKRRFDTGVDQADRLFDFTARTGDRDFNYRVDSDQATRGLTASQGNSQLAAILASILSNNSIASGQAAGAGAIGGSNAITNLITQLLGQMNGNNIVNNSTGKP